MRSMCMCMRVRVRVWVIVIVIMIVLVRGLRMIRRQYIHFGRGQAAAVDFAHLQARAHIQRRGCFGKHAERNPSVDERAQKHVATDTGEAL